MHKQDSGTLRTFSFMASSLHLSGAAVPRVGEVESCTTTATLSAIRLPKLANTLLHKRSSLRLLSKPQGHHGKPMASAGSLGLRAARQIVDRARPVFAPYWESHVMGLPHLKVIWLLQTRGLQTVARKTDPAAPDAPAVVAAAAPLRLILAVLLRSLPSLAAVMTL